MQTPVAGRNKLHSAGVDAPGWKEETADHMRGMVERLSSPNGSAATIPNCVRFHLFLKYARSHFPQQKLAQMPSRPSLRDIASSANLTFIHPTELQIRKVEGETPPDMELLFRNNIVSFHKLSEIKKLLFTTNYCCEILFSRKHWVHP